MPLSYLEVATGPLDKPNKKLIIERVEQRN